MLLHRRVANILLGIAVAGAFAFVFTSETARATGNHPPAKPHTTKPTEPQTTPTHPPTKPPKAPKPPKPPATTTTSTTTTTTAAPPDGGGSGILDNGPGAGVAAGAGGGGGVPAGLGSGPPASAGSGAGPNLAAGPGVGATGPSATPTPASPPAQRQPISPPAIAPLPPAALLDDSPMVPGSIALVIIVAGLATAFLVFHGASGRRASVVPVAPVDDGATLEFE